MAHADRYNGGEYQASSACCNGPERDRRTPIGPSCLRNEHIGTTNDRATAARFVSPRATTHTSTVKKVAAAAATGAATITTSLCQDNDTDPPTTMAICGSSGEDTWTESVPHTSVVEHLHRRPSPCQCAVLRDFVCQDSEGRDGILFAQ